MVRHEIDDHFQPGIVGALHQLGELLHAVGYAGSQVGVYVIVVLDSIGRTCLALNCSLVVGADALLAIVGLCGVLNDTGVPHVCGAQLFDSFERFGGEVGKLAATVLFDASVRNTFCIVVAEKAGEDLIKDDFRHIVLFLYFTDKPLQHIARATFCE